MDEVGKSGHSVWAGNKYSEYVTDIMQRNSSMYVDLFLKHLDTEAVEDCGLLHLHCSFRAAPLGHLGRKRVLVTA